MIVKEQLGYITWNIAFWVFLQWAIKCFLITYVRIVVLPWTVKVIFITRNTKTSKTEGEGGGHIARRILPSLEGNCSSGLSECYLSRHFKLASYVSRRNASLEYNVFNWIWTGQVKITLKMPGIKTFKKFWRNARILQTLERTERTSKWVTVLQLTFKVMWLAAV